MTYWTSQLQDHAARHSSWTGGYRGLCRQQGVDGTVLTKLSLETRMSASEYCARKGNGSCSHTVSTSDTTTSKPMSVKASTNPIFSLPCVGARRWRLCCETGFSLVETSRQAAGLAIAFHLTIKQRLHIAQERPPANCALGSTLSNALPHATTVEDMHMVMMGASKKKLRDLAVVPRQGMLGGPCWSVGAAIGGRGG